MYHCQIAFGFNHLFKKKHIELAWMMGTHTLWSSNKLAKENEMSLISPNEENFKDQYTYAVRFQSTSNKRKIKTMKLQFHSH